MKSAAYIETSAETKRKIETTIQGKGYESPIICTPEELMGDFK